jgi:hypothetical protein
MGEITVGSQAELRCNIVERLAAAQKSAPLSRRLVRDAAAACGVAESTMWRWITRGGPTPRARRGMVPSERAVELLLQWRGNVAAVHRQLREEGEEVPSPRTLGRAFERGLSPAQRDFARRGDAAVRDRKDRSLQRPRGRQHTADQVFPAHPDWSVPHAVRSPVAFGTLSRRSLLAAQVSRFSVGSLDRQAKPLLQRVRVDGFVVALF